MSALDCMLFLINTICLLALVKTHQPNRAGGLVILLLGVEPVDKRLIDAQALAVDVDAVEVVGGGVSDHEFAVRDLLGEAFGLGDGDISILAGHGNEAWRELLQIVVGETESASFLAATN